RMAVTPRLARRMGACVVEPVVFRRDLVETLRGGAVAPIESRDIVLVVPGKPCAVSIYPDGVETGTYRKFTTGDHVGLPIRQELGGLSLKAPAQAGVVLGQHAGDRRRPRLVISPGQNISFFQMLGDVARFALADSQGGNPEEIQVFSISPKSHPTMLQAALFTGRKGAVDGVGVEAGLSIPVIVKKLLPGFGLDIDGVKSEVLHILH